MTEPLDEMYFVWLCGQVDQVLQQNPRNTHWNLLRVLYKKEFVWIVANDDNRAEDGRELRREFAEFKGVIVDPDWLRLGCSMLELLLGVARHLSFLVDGSSMSWFWALVKHLGMTGLTDNKVFDPDGVEYILEMLIWRQYGPDGLGGLFPLEHPQEDQRQVEIWYQMNQYLLEKGYF